MTLVLAGMSKGSVATSLNSKTNVMTITRNADQSISIAGWNANTHNIVYDAAISPFLNYAKKAAGTGGAPTVEEISSAHASVWKAAGLAST